MPVPQDALIHIEALTKVFYTDEVETHALSGVHLTVGKGEYVSMSGPRAAESQLCCRFLGCWIRRLMEPTRSTDERWQASTLLRGRASAIRRSGSYFRAST